MRISSCKAWCDGAGGVIIGSLNKEIGLCAFNKPTRGRQVRAALPNASRPADCLRLPQCGRHAHAERRRHLHGGLPDAGGSAGHSAGAHTAHEHTFADPRSQPFRRPHLRRTISFASSTPAIGGGVSSCDNSAFVSDVTIPDGTMIKPGEKFTKTWRMYNSGTCNWTTSYKIAFDSGDAMGGATTVLPAQVNSGSQMDISVAMMAPTFNGTFKGNWRMQNATGAVIRQRGLRRDQGDHRLGHGARDCIRH